MSSGHRNFAGAFLKKLARATWFSAFSASVCATIVGISLTFGIDSCIEHRREKKEMQKSMLQAVDNLGERIEDAQRWVEIIENENRLYEISDSIYSITKTLNDSLCREFYNSVPYIRISAFDHEFEKIFRGSYQLWQLQSANDSLAFYISQCYDGLNMVEQTCQTLSEGMVEQIGAVNAAKHFYRTEPREWTLTLLSDPQFQYFMSIRKVKASVAAYILQQVIEDYDANVVPRSNALR